MSSTAILRTRDAARRLNVSASFLEKHRCLGTGPMFVRLGRVIGYREADLEAWIAARVCTSTSEPAHIAGDRASP